MTDNRATSGDDLLLELAAELGAVAPSPEFAARVRARLAEAPAARHSGWWLACAGAAALTMVVAGALMMHNRAPERTGLTSDVPMSAVRSAAPPLRPSPDVRTPAEPAAAGRTPPVAAARIERPAPRRRTAAVDVRFEVVTNQSAVLAEIWRAAPPARQPINGELPVVAATLGADGSIVVPDIAVEPIVVPPIGLPAGGQGRIQRVTSPQATGSPR